MTLLELMADAAMRNTELLKMAVADFTEAQWLVRPCEGANHALWQVGHLVNAETGLINAARPGAMPELPAGFAERFDNRNNGVDDPAFFGVTPAQLLELFGKTRAASVNWLRSLSLEDFDNSTPARLQGFAPTIYHLAAMQQHHLMMHLGQIQVIRRRLGKPVLF